MILAHLDVIISKLILIVLVLGSLNFILVSIFRVLIKIRLSLAVDANSEQFAAIVVSTAGSDSILDHLECLINCRKCIEISAFNSGFKCSFLSSKVYLCNGKTYTRFRSLYSFSHILSEFNVCFRDINSSIGLMTINYEVKFGKFNG